MKCKRRTKSEVYKIRHLEETIQERINWVTFIDNMDLVYCTRIMNYDQLVFAGRFP